MRFYADYAATTHKGSPQARIDRIELMLFDDQPICEVSVQPAEDTLEAWLAQDFDASQWGAYQWPGFAFLFFEQAYEPRTDPLVCELPAPQSIDTLDAWLAMDVPELEAVKDESGLGSVKIAVISVLILAFIVASVMVIKTELDIRRERARRRARRLQEDAQRRTMPAPVRDPEPAPETEPAAQVKVDDIVLSFTPRQAAQTGQPIVEIPQGVVCTTCDRCTSDATGLLRLMAEDILLPAVWGELVVHNGTWPSGSLGRDATHLFLGSNAYGGSRGLRIGEHTFTCQVSEPPKSGEPLVVDEATQMPLVWRQDHLIIILPHLVLPSDFWNWRPRSRIMDVHRAIFEHTAAALEPDAALRQSRRAALKARRDREAIDRFAALKRDQLVSSRGELEASIKRLRREETDHLAEYMDACLALPALDSQIAQQEQARDALAERCARALQALRELPIVGDVHVDDDLLIVFVPDGAGQWSVRVPLGSRGRRIRWGYRPTDQTTAATWHTAPAAAIMNALAGPLVELDLAAIATRLHNMVRAGLLVPFNQETL